MTNLTAPADAPVVQVQGRRGIASTRLIVIGVGVAILLTLSIVSLFVGSGNFTPQEVIDALRGRADATTELLIREYRLARTVIAIVAGVSLGLAGTIMQALTRNPLADPGILGVNAGAYTAVVFTALLVGPQLKTTHVWMALLGALLASLIVFVIGTTGVASRSPAKLVLTGIAFGAVLSGVSYAVTLMNPQVFDRIRFWNLGSIQGRTFGDLTVVLPFIGVGVLIALVLPRSLDTLALGDEVAIALGSRPVLIRIAGLISIALLCGAATAVIGPISFVGLMVPHLLRISVGPAYTWLIPLSVIAAPILLLGADILGRVLVPSEMPAGIVTAVIGAPVLIYIARRQGVRAL